MRDEFKSLVLRRLTGAMTARHIAKTAADGICVVGDLYLLRNDGAVSPPSEFQMENFVDFGVRRRFFDQFADKIDAL